MHDFRISFDEGLIKIRPLNEDAMNWIRITVLKPMKCPEKLEPRIDFVSVQACDLEHTLRNLLAAGYKVDFQRATFEVSA